MSQSFAQPKVKSSANETSESDVEEVISDTQEDNNYSILSSSFLGKTQPRTYDWCRQKILGTASTTGFKCKFLNCPEQSLTLKNYSSHLSNYHGSAFSFTCPFCPRVFGSLTYLYKHTRKYHRSLDVICDSENIDPPNVTESVIDFDVPSPPVEIDSQKALSSRLARFINGSSGEDVLLNSLRDTSATWNQAFRFLGSAGNITKDLIQTVSLCLSKIAEQRPDLLSNDISRQLMSACENFKFCSVENEYQLIRLLKQNTQFVPPKDLVFGSEYETRSVRGKTVYIEAERTGQFVPISQVLKETILFHDEIFGIMSAYRELLKTLSKSGIILDCMQTEGKLSFSNSLNRSTVLSELDVSVDSDIGEQSFYLSLELYFDEIEPVNPIGSRATIHKIGCFYWSLKNLPPWLLSDMRMIHLAALVSYLDIETYGFKQVLCEIKNDLLTLEKGVEIKTKLGCSYTVASRRFIFVADNLAYHAVFGFNKSFSGGSCCEKCTLPQSLFKTVFEERFQDLRTPDSCPEDALRKRNGVKTFCLLQTDHFDPYKNFTCDLHHDIFQGSLMNIIRVVLNDLIPECLSVDILNSRTNNFGYGRDIDGKPSEFDFDRIKDKSHGHFREKYDQMFTLYRFLPLMFYDLVPCTEVWKFLLDFFDLISFLLSPAFVESDYQQLGVLIREYLLIVCSKILNLPKILSFVSDDDLESYTNLFPSESVTFKQHKLIHFPRILKCSGPFLYQSVLRYERKHQFFKRLTHNICNFKNICKSLAIRHQVNEYHEWKDGVPMKSDSFPGCKFDKISDIWCRNVEFQKCLSSKECMQSMSAIIKGTRFSVNDVLISDVTIEDCASPVFVLVQKILVANEKFFFACKAIKTHFYQNKSRSYCVSVDDEADVFLIQYESLFDFHPLSLHKCSVPDCKLDHVVLRHILRYNNYASDLQ